MNVVFTTGTPLVRAFSCQFYLRAIKFSTTGKLSMSSIEITDLDRIDTDLFTILTNSELICQIIGGGNTTVKVGSPSLKSVSIDTSSLLPPFSNSTSISIANATKTGPIATTVNVNLNTNFTVNSSNDRQGVNGSIGFTVDTGNLPH
jgi:hypothetical protein